MNRFLKLRYWSALLLALLLVGCGDEEEQAAVEQQPSPTPTPVSPLLAHIPSDSAYIFANIEPMPGEVSDKFWEAAEPFLTFAQNQVSRGIQTLEDKEALDGQERLAHALLSELDGNLSRDGLRRFGFGGDFMAFYGYGVLPVMRVQLSDGDAFRTTIDRVEAAADAQFPDQEASGATYFDVGDDEVRFMIAVHDDQLAMTVSPAAAPAHDIMREQILGDAMPASNAKQRLEQVNAAYGLTPAGTAVVNVKQLASLILTDESPLSNALFGEHRAEVSEVCRNEFLAMADIAPRLVSGYTRLDASRLDQLTVLELREDLAKELKEIALPMRGLEASDEGAAYFAFAADLMKLKAFAQNRVAAMQAEPFQCELFGEFNAQLTQMEQQLAQPLPPFVGNFQGARVMLEDVDFDADQPGKVRAMVAVAMTNPQLMLGMAQAFVPQLAEMNVTMDGTPVPLPDGLIPALVESPYVAMMEHGLAMSVGAGQEQKLKAFLDAEPPSGPAPILAFSYDAQMLGAMQQRMMEASMEQGRQAAAKAGEESGSDDAADGDTTQSAEAEEAFAYMETVQQELQQAMKGYYEVFRRISGKVLLTDRGIEIQTTTLMN